MNETVFLAGYVLLCISVMIGLARFKYLDRPLRIVVVLLLLSVFTEMAAYLAVKINEVLIKSVIYHVYSMVEMVFITAFFLKAIKPYHYRKLMIVNVFIWPIMGVLNILFFQSIDGLNTNMLMLESFSIITMSLYFIYWLLKNNVTDNVFEHPHFWIAILWLVLWSCTFFFWASLRVLYADHWHYINYAITMQALLLLFTYVGFCFVFLLYPSKMKTIGH